MRVRKLYSHTNHLCSKMIIKFREIQTLVSLRISIFVKKQNKKKIKNPLVIKINFELPSVFSRFLLLLLTD